MLALEDVQQFLESRGYIEEALGIGSNIDTMAFLKLKSSKQTTLRDYCHLNYRGNTTIIRQTSEIGQPPYKGQRVHPQSVLFSEVQLVPSPTDLQQFLRCATGSPHYQGNSVFASTGDSPAFSFCVCGNHLALSEPIESQEEYEIRLKVAMAGKEFTTR